jgi:putative FmdB family regulatory protein
MPIYAYKCASCGYAKDALQKMSDPPLTVCPSCGEPTFQKQLTAAGFQLKGSGWYVTDFRDAGKGATGKDQKPDAPAAASAEGAAAASAPASGAASAPAPTSAPSPATAPAPSTGSASKD